MEMIKKFENVAEIVNEVNSATREFKSCEEITYYFAKNRYCKIEKDGDDIILIFFDKKGNEYSYVNDIDYFNDEMYFRMI